MPLVTASQFNLQPDVQQAMQQGLQTRAFSQQEANRQLLSQQQQERLAAQQRALGVPAAVPTEESRDEALLRVIAADPAAAQSLLKVTGINTQQQREEAAAFATEALTSSPERVTQLIDQRVRNLTAQGRDASDTLALRDLPPQDQITALRGLKTAALSESERIAGAGISGAGLKQFAPVTLVNDAGEKKIVIPTADPRSGAARLEPASFPPGFRISTETPDEKRQADIIAAEQKKAREVTGKTLAERRAIQIDNGLDAADGMANLRRAKQLLDDVETGGIDAVSLRARQVFGIEGENEAELSNRLGKAVLSQLRATFGAAFTAAEGAQLSRIEAGFGKSTAGNKRLIEQTMQIVQRTAERGIRAAEKVGDMDAANEIRQALEFTLSSGGQLPQGVTEEDIAETMRANNMTREQVLQRLGVQ